MHLEEKINFNREVSVLYASSNETECFFPLSENYHKNGILKHTIAPAILEQKIEIKLKLIKSLQIIKFKGSFNYGTFQLNDDFIFNEIAPRPHNSFHWTIEGCKNSQFEILVKSITGQDINDQIANQNWKMINLLGDDIENLKTFNFHKDQNTYLWKKEVKMKKDGTHYIPT